MKSWKSTLLGFVIGLIPVGQQILNAFSQGQHVDFTQLGLGIGIMALGYVVKDKDVTGGTRRQ